MTQPSDGRLQPQVSGTGRESTPRCIQSASRGRPASDVTTALVRPTGRSTDMRWARKTWTSMAG